MKVARPRQCCGASWPHVSGSESILSPGSKIFSPSLPITLLHGSGQRHFQFRHGLSLKQLPAGHSQPTRHPSSGAVGRNAGVRVHLAIQPGNEQKRKPPAQRWYALGSAPDLSQAVKVIPNALRTLTNLIGRHRRMGAEHLGSRGSGNQPVAGDRNSVHLGNVARHPLHPLVVVDRTGNGVIITNCANVRSACFAKVAVAEKVSSPSEGSPKMNDPSTCTPCCLIVLRRLARLSPARLKL